MQKIETHPYLCFYHWQRGQQANDAVVFASQLLNENQQLNTPAAVIDVLSGVFRLLAQGRLETRQAATMAYVCQLALQALPQAEKRERAAAESRGNPSELYNIIQKGSFEEDLFLNLRDVFLGRKTKGTETLSARIEQVKRSQSPAPDEETNPGGIRVPGTCITLPPPLQRECEPSRNSAGTEDATEPASSEKPAQPPSPPHGLTPEMEKQLMEAGRGTPEEDLQRACNSGPVRIWKPI